MTVSNDVRQLNMPTTGSVQQTSAVQPATSAAAVDVTASVNNDTVTTGNTQNAQNNTKRNSEQLYQAIQALCSSNGIDFNEVKKMGLLSTVSGKNEEYLLNAEQAEINKLVKLIEETIAAMKEDGIELTAENLEKQARGYQIQIACGWDSVASFRASNKKSHESVIQRLNRFFGCDFEKLSVDQQAEKLDAYFNRYFEGADSIESIGKKQLTDFSKLLYNTSPEERVILKNAIEYLCANNRTSGFVSILRSFDTDAQRTEFANNVTHEEIQNMGTRPDRAGNVPSSEDMTALTAAALEWKDEEHVTEYHQTAQEAREEFMTEENIAKIEAIKVKVENGEELTEEEQALLQEYKFHTSDAAGEFVGVGNNEVVSENFKTEMLETLNTDAYKNPNYREVLDQVNKYIEEHPETLNMPAADFVAKMNEVTNGNFEKVVSGSSEPLAAPVVKEETTQRPAAAPLTATDIEARRERINTLYSEMAANTTDEAQEAVEVQGTASKSKREYFMECAKNATKSQFYTNELKKMASLLPAVLQTKALQLTTGAVFNAFLGAADNSAILGTDGKGRTTYQSNLLAERIEEIKEEDQNTTLVG